MCCQFISRAIDFIKYFPPVLYCPAGASPLGEMPSAGKLASSGLAAANAGEDPLASSAAGEIRPIPSPHPPEPLLSGELSASSSGSVSGQGFSLSHGFPLIPAKVANKIQKWEFINMSELLPDNLELARHSAESCGTSSCATLKSPKKRELSEDWKGLVAWSVCFNTFVAIIAKKHPEKGQELLAYHSTILVEALRFGCKGWMSYDRMFREHVEKEPSSNWSLLHFMFYSLSFLSQRVEASTCPKCMGSDHSKTERALSALEPQQEPFRSRPAESVRQSGPAKKRFRREGTPQTGGQDLGSAKSVCFSYNEGQCFRHPKPCDRAHKCIRCGGDHKMIDCKATYVQSSQH